MDTEIYHRESYDRGLHLYRYLARIDDDRGLKFPAERGTRSGVKKKKEKKIDKSI